MNSQELRALQESYNQVYQLDEISDRKVNSMVAQRRRQFNRADEGGSAREIHLARNLVKAEKSAERRSQRLNKEQVDLYDIILSHLLDEGYADTEQAAEAIMVNMSEEWREDIMEISDKRVMAARNALAKRTDKSVGGGDGNQYSKNVSREARMNARIQSRNQRTGSNVEPTFTRRHQ